MRIKKGERLYKFYYFRPVALRHSHFEYRILTKEKTNGKLEMVSYNFKIESGAPKKKLCHQSTQNFKKRTGSDCSKC